MKRMNNLKIPVVLFFAAMVMTTGAWGAEPPLMTRQSLKAAMASGDLTILDVRADRDWNASEFKIAGAIRVDPDRVDAWADYLTKEKTTVVYCA